MTHDTAYYKKILESMLTEITAELRTLGIHNPDNVHDWVATPEVQESGEADPNVVADRVEDWDERRATLATLEKQYNDIVQAIGKLAHGTYGICEIGGEHISAERLDANPAARTCADHMHEESSLST